MADDPKLKLNKLIELIDFETIGMLQRPRLWSQNDYSLEDQFLVMMNYRFFITGHTDGRDGFITGHYKKFIKKHYGTDKSSMANILGQMSALTWPQKTNEMIKLLIEFRNQMIKSISMETTNG